MDFLTFLEKYDKQDVSKVKAIVESNAKKEEAIINEAFSSTYPSKKEALFNLEKYFTSKKTAPKGVDVKYVNENMDRLKDKIESLTEGDIRIIIHNHEGTKDKPGIDYTEEGIEVKKKRGRPSKPSVVYGVEDDAEVMTDDAITPPTSEPEIKTTEDDSEEDDSDELIEALSQMGLTEKELRAATDMATSGVIDETDDSKIAKAAKVISKINSLG